MHIRIGVFSLFLALVFVILVGACSSQKSKEPTQENSKEPSKEEATTNDRSELAILMRSMYNYTKAYEDSVIQLQPFNRKKYAEFTKMKTATATEPSDIDDQYQAMADGFLASLELLTHKETVSLENYNNMVDNCLACHKMKCPGPMVIIRKLKIKEEV